MHVEVCKNSVGTFPQQKFGRNLSQILNTATLTINAGGSSYLQPQTKNHYIILTAV